MSNYHPGYVNKNATDAKDARDITKVRLIFRENKKKRVEYCQNR